MSVTAGMVKNLRQITNAGMMECKKALVESEGDIEKATELLRKKGIASAVLKASPIVDFPVPDTPATTTIMLPSLELFNNSDNAVGRNH